MLRYHLTTPARHRLVLFTFAGLMALVVATAVLLSAANALTVTNRAESTQELTIVIDDSSQPLVLEPKESIGGFCPEGCIIIHPSGEELEFEGTETVLIDEDGFQLQD